MITIRKMNAGDEEAVFGMMRLFYDSDAVLHTSSDAILRKDIQDAVSEEMPLLDGYVFTEDGRYAGYGMTTMCYTTEYGGVAVWLEDFYLKPEYRNRGFSTTFFRFLEEQYPHAVRFKLEVEQENEGAVAAYRKNGYEVSPYFEMTKEMIED